MNRIIFNAGIAILCSASVNANTVTSKTIVANGTTLNIEDRIINLTTKGNVNNYNPGILTQFGGDVNSNNVRIKTTGDYSPGVLNQASSKFSSKNNLKIQTDGLYSFEYILLIKVLSVMLIIQVL
ncbi:hypothetical protein IHC92_17260 [Photobacterium damselae subsp. damselae]|uniref:hypothetical protein n=1 Tax=Photobacterium damselae TaxID=38293 RepID=UPI001F267680|nr:hypothetical protein [Photobacterium damselae]UKA23911.1 hypothetical protein IHC92_17260 [Photobacterium damselae subsp. damselae]